MRIQTLLVVGVGLIGGSIARAARQRGLADRILGVSHRPSTRQFTLESGLVDEAFATPAEGIARADFAVFCTPVEQLITDLLTAGPLARPGTVLTDAGSTKASVVEALAGKLPSQVEFVGSHPLAGSEKQGPTHADADLFVNRLVIVTPDGGTTERALNRTTKFWESLGARVRRMPPAEHDRALALTSHLPHLAASALAGILPPELVDLTATGFRDTTRIAAGSPSVWTSIFQTNRAAVLAALDLLEARLRDFRSALTDDDRQRLERLLAEGKERRDQLTP
jgi:prephenate dehydrogenase